MGIFDYPYLSERQLKGFENYKYSSVDTSPVAIYVSHPFWNQVVKLYPSWLAPNVLTFSGMVLVMFVFFLMSFLDYSLYASSDSFPDYPPIPLWTWLTAAGCSFLAHVLDGTDGKQARKTGASGPTGELFDHGIDSWLTVPFTVAMYSVFGRADYSVSAFRLLLIMMSVQLVFIVSHWEKYNTGVLFLPWGYDISQYSLAGFYLMTYLLGGHSVWKFYLIPSLKFSPANLAEILFYFSCFGMSIPMALWNIAKCHRSGGGLKQPTALEIMLPLFSTSILFATSMIWVVFSPSGIIDADPRIFIWTIGTIFSNIACRLIVNQMTGTRCQAFNWLLCPYLTLITFSLFAMDADAQLELPLLRILAVAVTLLHTHYGICVVRQMCKHFGIYCFSLEKPEARPGSEEKGSGGKADSD